MAKGMTFSQLVSTLRDPDEIKRSAFDVAKTLAQYVSDVRTSKAGHDLLLRALEYRDSFGPAVAIIDALVRHVGLFPYLDPMDLGLAESIAYEFHRPLNMDTDEIVFHRVQAEVYARLMEGENVVLSAPTSFGKSLIIDAVVASGIYHHIAIVVPTIALIDETRRRLSRFSSSFKIITHGSQKRGPRNIFVMTQERILEYNELEPLDFFVIDEFYKLKPRPEDKDRSYLLNEAFYRLRKTGAQFYLLGPNIRGVDANLAEEQGLYFLATDYKTVVSEIVREHPPKGLEEARLVELCLGLKEQTLIYCSSPARVRKICESLIAAQAKWPSEQLRSAVSWIGREYSPDWLFPRALACGIGMHHGRLPRSLAQFGVRAFNEGLLRVLVCTSTLIEGVNTKAKNVIIFDNKVARRKFDYFTYNNIIGRSGRMFQHFIGRVFMFHEPPADELPFVDVPVLSQPDDIPESLLVQMDDEDLSPTSRDRLSDISAEGSLDMSVIRQSRGIDPRAQISLAEELARRPQFYWNILNWKRWPESAQLYGVCGLVWTHFVGDNRRRAGVSSGNQLAFTIGRFRALGSPSELLRERLAVEEQQSADEIVEETMEWLRQWANFSFPRYLMAVDRIQRAVFRRRKLDPGDFSFFAGQVENWFLDPATMALDEYGIPIQLAARLEESLKPDGDLDAVLDRLRRLDVDKLHLPSFEKSLVIDAQAHL